MYVMGPCLACKALFKRSKHIACEILAKHSSVQALFTSSGLLLVKRPRQGLMERPKFRSHLPVFRHFTKADGDPLKGFPHSCEDT